MPRAFLDFSSCIILAKCEVKFKKEISGQQISPFSMESISRLIQRGNCLGKLENITVSHSDLNLRTASFFHSFSASLVQYF